MSVIKFRLLRAGRDRSYSLENNGNLVTLFKKGREKIYSKRTKLDTPSLHDALL